MSRSLAVALCTALCLSLCGNLWQWHGSRELSRDNAEMAATIDRLNAARAADARAWEFRARETERIDELTEERRQALDQAVDEAASDDALLLSRLRGMFGGRP